jgi:hypothetical protein
MTSPILVGVILFLADLPSTKAARAEGTTNHSSNAVVTNFHEAAEVGRWSLLIAIAGLLVVLPLALWLFALAVWGLRAGWRKRQPGQAPALPFPSPVVLGWIRGAIVGTDKRLSTSKTVAVVWTYTVAAALLSIVIAKLWGHPHAYNALVDQGLQAEYAVLVGGPLGAAILAKAIVTTQLNNGQSKPDTTTGANVADLVSNDQGVTDFGDLQYVLFNTVALVFFYGEFLSSPQLGLPTIPNVLVGLASVSAVGYLGKKVLPAPAREITKIQPEVLKVVDVQDGADFKIWGSRLQNSDGSAPIVRLDSVHGAAPVSAGTVLVANTGAEGLVVDASFSKGVIKAGTYQLVVITDDNTKIAYNKTVVVG